MTSWPPAGPPPDGDGSEVVEPLGAGDYLSGRLLVASPRLADPSFTRTVVYVLDHGAVGALGLVLNRPTGVAVEEILAPWHELAAKSPPPVIFSGGPVGPGAVVGLVSGVSVDKPVGWHQMIGDVGTADLSVSPSEQPCAFGGARLFSGYAGWSADQLEEEMRQGAWFCVEAAQTDLLTENPDGLWHDVLRRQGGELGILAAYPPHPSAN